MPTMYAVVESGGKQYRVSPGDVIAVDHLIAQAGDTINLDKVLLVNNDGDISVGHPHLEGAHVVAQVEGDQRGEKIIVFRYKSKVRERKKTGHRAIFSKLTIKSIETGAAAPHAAPRRRTAAHKKTEGSDGA